MRSKGKRFAAVLLHALPLEAVHATDLTEPCAVREKVRGRSILVSVSDAALEAGVRVRGTEAEGRATCGELRVRDREPSFELAALARAADLLLAFGPEVEVDPPFGLFVELSRSQSWLRSSAGQRALEASGAKRPVGRAAGERELLEHIVTRFEALGHAVVVALADDPDTARTFAEHLAHERTRHRAPRPVPSKGRRGKKEVSAAPDAPPPPRTAVIPPGEGRRALARLPIERLTWTDARTDPDGERRGRWQRICEGLRALGAHSVGALAKFPAEDIGARFGALGVRLLERARAETTRPLRLHRPPEVLDEQLEFDAATEALEPILALIERQLRRLEVRMEARQLAAGSLRLELLVEPGLERAVEADAPRAASSKLTERIELRLARPTRSADTMLAIVREKLGGALPGAVLAVRIFAERAETDRGAQLDLFSRRARRAEALAELVGRLEAALGEGAVTRPRLEEQHRPEAAWTAEPFSVEAALAPIPEERPPPAPRALPSVVAEAGPSTRALPVVDAQLSVVSGASELRDEGGALPEEAWPKPRSRRLEDEPIPPLPPRPLELLSVPEPARWDRGRQALSWRGEQRKVRAVFGREALDTDWWKPRGAQLERDYFRVETDDGSELWLFSTPAGATYVHGVFD